MLRVGEHHALGQAGGAAGVRQHRDVLGRVDRHVRHRCPVEASSSCTLRWPSAVSQVQTSWTVARTAAAATGSSADDGDHQRGLAVEQLVGQVLRGVERVDSVVTVAPARVAA